MLEQTTFVPADHETGLVYIPSFERVGGEEFDRQTEMTAQ